MEAAATTIVRCAAGSINGTMGNGFKSIGAYEALRLSGTASHAAAGGWTWSAAICATLHIVPHHSTVRSAQGAICGGQTTWMREL